MRGKTTARNSIADRLMAVVDRHVAYGHGGFGVSLAELGEVLSPGSEPLRPTAGSSAGTCSICSPVGHCPLQTCYEARECMMTDPKCPRAAGLA